MDLIKQAFSKFIMAYIQASQAWTQICYKAVEATVGYMDEKLGLSLSNLLMFGVVGLYLTARFTIIISLVSLLFSSSLLLAIAAVPLYIGYELLNYFIDIPYTMIVDKITNPQALLTRMSVKVAKGIDSDANPSVWWKRLLPASWKNKVNLFTEKLSAKIEAISNKLYNPPATATESTQEQKDKVTAGNKYTMLMQVANAISTLIVIISSLLKAIGAHIGSVVLAIPIVVGSLVSAIVEPLITEKIINDFRAKEEARMKSVDDKRRLAVLERQSQAEFIISSDLPALSQIIGDKKVQFSQHCEDALTLLRTSLRDNNFSAAYQAIHRLQGHITTTFGSDALLDPTIARISECITDGCLFKGKGSIKNVQLDAEQGKIVEKLISTFERLQETVGSPLPLSKNEATLDNTNKNITNMFNRQQMSNVVGRRWFAERSVVKHAGPILSITNG